MGEEKRDKMTHNCGCVTTKRADGVIEVNPCELHKTSGYVWIALQHDKKKEIEAKIDIVEESSGTH